MSQKSSEPRYPDNKVKNKTIMKGSVSKVTIKSIEKRSHCSEIPKKKEILCEKRYHSSDMIHSHVVKNKDGIVLSFYKAQPLVTKAGRELDNHEGGCTGESSRKLIKLDDSAYVSENPAKKFLVDISDKENIKVPIENQIPNATVESKYRSLNTSVNNEENLFDIVLKEKNNIKLPSSYWTLHYCLDVKKIIVTCVQVLYDKDKIQRAIPNYTKEVVIHDDSCIQLRFLGQDYTWTDITSLPQIFPKSLADFEELLNKLDKLEICVGGPPLRHFRNINPRCAYKDIVVWRHNKCPVVLERGKICLRCHSLHNVLRRHLDKNIKSHTKPKSKASRRS